MLSDRLEVPGQLTFEGASTSNQLCHELVRDGCSPEPGWTDALSGVVDEEIDRDCEELNLGYHGLGAAGAAAACDAAPAWLAERLALVANFLGLMVTLLVELCVL